MPTVSVLITVYNRESYLRDAIESVLDSTWTDYELLIVDDASTDKSLDIAKSYAERDSRIKVLKNTENLGDYRNRNKAATVAVGKYLKYLDADDVLYRNSLSVMVEAMNCFPEAALALSINEIDPEQPFPIQISSRKAFVAHFLGKSVFGAGPSASIIRRDCFEAVRGFSGRQFIGDTELWLKIAARWPIVALQPSLVWWRRHEGQQMNEENRRPEVLDQRFQFNQSVLNESELLTSDEKSKGMRVMRQHHARRILSYALKMKQPKVAWQLYRASGLSMHELLKGFKKYAQAGST